jgi:hypothetical protein
MIPWSVHVTVPSTTVPPFVGQVGSAAPEVPAVVHL